MFVEKINVIPFHKKGITLRPNTKTVGALWRLSPKHKISAIQILDISVCRRRQIKAQQCTEIASR